VASPGSRQVLARLDRRQGRLPRAPDRHLGPHQKPIHCKGLGNWMASRAGAVHQERTEAADKGPAPR
jgi:hypothetical protein